MDPIKRILAPTDLSALSLIGIRYALEMARSQEAEVTVYHVADYREAIPSQERNVPHFKNVEQFLNERKKGIEEFLRKAFPELVSKVKSYCEVEVGVVYEKIVEKAAKDGMDMIILSTHGRTGLSHMLVGSVTEKVVRHAACPVLSIHPQPEEKLGQKPAVVA